MSEIPTRAVKKIETRQKLFDAAQRLYSHSSFDAVKVEDITREADVAKGTFFNYFDSKEDIICEMQYFVTYDKLMPLLTYDGPVVPLIKEALIELLLEKNRSKSLLRAVLLAQLKDNHQLEKLAEQLHSFYEGMIELVDKAKRQGEIDQQIDSRVVVRTVEQMYMGIIMQWCCDMTDSPIDHFIGTSFDVLFEGFQRYTPKSSASPMRSE